MPRRARAPSPRSASRSSAASNPTPEPPPGTRTRPPGIRTQPTGHPRAPMPAGRAPKHIRSPPTGHPRSLMPAGRAPKHIRSSSCTRARTEAGARVHIQEQINAHRASALADVSRARGPEHSSGAQPRAIARDRRPDPAHASLPLCPTRGMHPFHSAPPGVCIRSVPERMHTRERRIQNGCAARGRRARPATGRATGLTGGGAGWREARPATGRATGPTSGGAG